MSKKLNKILFIILIFQLILTINVSSSEIPSSFSISSSSYEEVVCGGLVFDIPEKTFSSENKIIVQKTTLAGAGYNDTIRPAEDAFLKNTDIYYEINLENQSNFNRFISVSFPFTTSDIPAGYSYNDMKIYYFNPFEQKWKRIGGEIIKVDDNNFFVKAQFNHFSLFTIVADSYRFSGNSLHNIVVSPNPFAPGGKVNKEIVTFKFELKNQSDITFRLFDRTGILIRELAHNKTFTAGVNTIEWDGKDSRGRIVPTGIYIFNFLVRADNNKVDKKSGTVIVSNKLRAGN